VPPESMCSPALELFRHRLLTIHHGAFQPKDYLARWVPPPVAELLERHAVELRPKRIVHIEGTYGPLECHRNALHHDTADPTASPWFGFGLYCERPSASYLWWIHSVCLDEDGTLFDSAPPSEPAHFIGIPWCLDLYQHLAQKPVDPRDLPPVLRRSMSSMLQLISTSP
jgi:hypothetical protein